MTLKTPFGDPSDEYLIGRLQNAELVFLPRHGRGHRFNPSEVNYRANIFGMKMLGVSWIISVSAVGSLQEEVVPGQIVLINQFIDRTKTRDATFFEKGIVAHVGFSEPICGVLHDYLEESCKEAKVVYHKQGTYVNMEGPAFSTIAESNLYRSWNATVIGMTALTEAKLAREAEISYAVIAMATDYDCWREGHDAVTVEAGITQYFLVAFSPDLIFIPHFLSIFFLFAVIQTLQANVVKVKTLFLFMSWNDFKFPRLSTKNYL